jgi:hypothetical protein
MQYVFDWEMSGSRKRQEISMIFDMMNKEIEPMFGVEGGGYGFQHKEEFKPLQAADILAWQMNNHIRKVMPLGTDSLDLLHPGFRLLREDEDMDLGFFTDSQIDNFIARNEALVAEKGPLPIRY